MSDFESILDTIEKESLRRVLPLNSDSTHETKLKYFNDNFAVCSLKDAWLSQLSVFIDKCSHEELLYIKKTVKILLKRDFIAQLPTEIALRILKYLSARDLFNCSQVSCHWKQLCNDSLLWRNLCEGFNIYLSQKLGPGYKERVTDLSRQSKLECDLNVGMIRDDSTASDNFCQIDWKKHYQRHMHIKCNWRNGGISNPVILPAHHNHVITCLEVYEHWAVSGSDDSSICIWDLNTGQCLVSLFGHLGGVWSITVLNPPKSQQTNDVITYPLLISGSCDRTARVWSLDGFYWPCISTLCGHQSTVRCLAERRHISRPTFYTTTGDFYMNSTSDNNHLSYLKDFNGDNQNSDLDFVGTNSELFGDDLCLIVTGSRDTTLRLWNVLNGECIHHFRGHRSAIRCVQFVGHQIVSGSYDSTIRLWCAYSGTCSYVFTDHTDRVYTLLFDGYHIISGSLDTKIRIWNCLTKKLEHTLSGHRSLTSEMIFHHPSRLLVSSNADETIRVWDINTGECVHVLTGLYKHQSAVTCIQMVHNFIVSSGDDGTVKLWNRESGEFIRDLVRLDGAGRGGVIWRILASNDRLVCAAGSRNGMESTKIVVLQFNEKDILGVDSCVFESQLFQHVCQSNHK